MSSKWLDSPSRRPMQPSSGRYAIRPPPPVTPTSVTRPEMPAVRVPVTFMDAATTRPPTPSASLRSARRPAAEPRAERYVLLRLDGVDAGSVVQLGSPDFAASDAVRANDLRHGMGA